MKTGHTAKIAILTSVGILCLLLSYSFQPEKEELHLNIHYTLNYPDDS